MHLQLYSQKIQSSCIDAIYILKVLDTFHDYFEGIKKDYMSEKENNEIVEPKNNLQNLTSENTVEDKDKIILKISYSDKTRQIFINDYFLLKNLKS